MAMACKEEDQRIGLGETPGEFLLDEFLQLSLRRVRVADRWQKLLRTEVLDEKPMYALRVASGVPQARPSLVRVNAHRDDIEGPALEPAAKVHHV